WISSVGVGNTIPLSLGDERKRGKDRKQDFQQERFDLMFDYFTLDFTTTVIFNLEDGNRVLVPLNVRDVSVGVVMGVVMARASSTRSNTF
ncbi:uncharacterized, partial [Tachysurus ichikawai]